MDISVLYLLGTGTVGIQINLQVFAVTVITFLHIIVGTVDINPEKAKLLIFFQGNVPVNSIEFSLEFVVVILMDIYTSIFAYVYVNGSILW